MLWSAGIVLSGVAGIAQVSALLALVLEQQEQTVFQRLREWYLDGKRSSGQKRRELDVTSCFGPLYCTQKPIPERLCWRMTGLVQSGKTGASPVSTMTRMRWLARPSPGRCKPCGRYTSLVSSSPSRIRQQSLSLVGFWKRASGVGGVLLSPPLSC